MHNPSNGSSPQKCANAPVHCESLACPNALLLARHRFSRVIRDSVSPSQPLPKGSSVQVILDKKSSTFVQRELVGSSSSHSIVRGVALLCIVVWGCTTHQTGHSCKYSQLHCHKARYYRRHWCLAEQKDSLIERKTYPVCYTLR